MSDLDETSLLPPHSVQAEQAVLGGILFDKSSFAQVADILKPEDFYATAHQVIYRACSELFAMSEPIDLVYVSERLKENNHYEQAGRTSYLMGLAMSVSTADAIVWHANAVKGYSTRRKLQSFAYELVGISQTEKESQALEFAQNSILKITQDIDVTKDLTTSELKIQTLEEIQDRLHHPEKVVGVQTGFPQLDRTLGSLRPGKLIILGARPSMGKAQPLDANVLTPTGFKKMGEIKIGDEVIGSDGCPHKVLGVFPQGVKQVYKVTLGDGASTECCDEHLWLTATCHEAKTGSVKSTHEIRNTLIHGHAIPKLNSSSLETIEKIEPTEEKECQCILVDSPDHLYVTDDFILTHNTGLALNIGTNIAVQQAQPVFIYSLEMEPRELMERALISIAESSTDLNKLQNASTTIPEHFLLIDRPGMTITQLRASLIKNRMNIGQPGLVIIDYLQLMKGVGGTRNEEVSGISRELKQIAREFKVPMMALAQLSRAVESRQDKRPMMSDLRDSGSIEADADTIIFLYRDEYYNKESDKRGTAEAIIAKNRGGSVGLVELYFRPSIVKFFNTMSNGYGQGNTDANF